MANGCFRICHPGHVLHLQQARELGEKLIVALTDDDHVNKPEGPIHTWEERAIVLRALRCVDEVIHSTSCAEAVRRIRPHVLVKGIDYLDSPLLDAARAACVEVGAQLYITSTPKLSTSEIIRRLHGTGNG